MSHEPDIFGYLATSKISEITTDLLDDSTKETYANKSNVKFWKGPISIWATVRASRTYPNGGYIPESGGVAVVNVNPGDTNTLQPEGTEVWEIQGIEGFGVGGSAVATISWFDGTSPVTLDAGQAFSTGGDHFDYNYAGGVPITNGQPMCISNSLYFRFEETGGAQGVVFQIAYHKVSL